MTQISDGVATQGMRILPSLSKHHNALALIAWILSPAAAGGEIAGSSARVHSVLRKIYTDDASATEVHRQRQQELGKVDHE